MSRQSQRQAYGEELVELGRQDPRIVALDADLSKSTMSCLFERAFPTRFFEMSIAEQNMMSTAAGLAAGGKIPFVSTFAVFATGRAYDQIRQTIAIGKLNVKICGSSAGLSDCGDGATHQSVEDIAIMNALPNMTVLTPCDANELRACMRTAANTEGPFYIRVGRSLYQDFTLAEEEFCIGKLRSISHGQDVAIFAHGVMVEVAMEAKEQLRARGIAARVVSVATMKPFDFDGAQRIAQEVRGVITAEEHTYIGGLAAMVALATCRSRTPMDYVALEDEFGQSAHSATELLEHYQLTADRIVSKAVALLSQ